MESQFKQITVNKKQLSKLIDKIGRSNLVTISVDSSRIEGDKILWVSNAKFGKNRIVVEAI